MGPLCSALEAFLGARPADDRVALAEAKLGPHRALLVPQCRQLLVEGVMLGDEGGVVGLGQRVEELGAALGELFDRFSDLVQ
jgi:hypothetical protein